METDVSVLEFYEQVDSMTGKLPAFNEMLFYTGSPDAEIVGLSEAPTLLNGPDDHTLYHAVTAEIGDGSVDDIASFLRTYPFQEGMRNDLFREYVDRILKFCDRPAEEIGFLTSVSVR